MSHITIPLVKPPAGVGRGRPITGSVTALARWIRRRFAGSELDEVFAYELIRIAAFERQYDRLRPGDQPHLEGIALEAEHMRDVALQWMLWDRQDLARFGYPIPRLSSFDPNVRAAYDALRPGQPYRIDGRIREKKATA